MEYIRKGCVGLYRNYYGPKDVIEFDGSLLSSFWELWRAEKEILKKNGFGVYKYPNGEWVIFCEVAFVEAWMKGREKLRKKLQEISPESLLKRYKENKINKKDLISELKFIIEYDFPDDPNAPRVEVNTEIVMKALDIYLQVMGICKQVRSYFEFLIASASWKRLKSELMLMYAFLFPERAKKENNVINHVLINEEYYGYGLPYYHSDELYLLIDFIHDNELKEIYLKEISWITRKNYLNSFYETRKIKNAS